MFLFRRTAAVDPRVRALQIDLADARQQATQLAARLVTQTRRADQAEQALDNFRAEIRDGHAGLLRLVEQQQREINQLRHDRDGALAQLDDALGCDEKMIATINAGSASKVAA